jgi:DNA-binding NarL/FixJ family response regulator
VSTAVLRIAVVGDCPLVRHGISHLIDTAPGLQLVATASSVRDADGTLRGADVVLLDLLQSRARLAATVGELRKRGHAVIVASSSAEIDPVQMIRAGAGGCLSRQAEGDELLTAIRVVASGRSYVSAPVGNLLKNTPHFTEREQEILQLLANGATDREIACQLRISTNTVHSHLDRIGEKTGTRRRSDLTRLAIEHGLIDGA